MSGVGSAVVPAVPDATERAGESGAPARATPRFPAFDGLRAIAAITVLGVHSAFVSGLTPRDPAVGIYTARLEAGVAVFFLISGFLLYRPFVVAHLRGAPKPATGSFWLRRVLRIVPAYWVALTASLLILGTATIGPGGWRAYLSHYLFAQIYFPDQRLHGLTQAWTLCVEMSFYLALPLYAAAIGARRARRGPGQRLRAEALGLLALVIISVVWRLFVYAHPHGPNSLSAAMAVWLPAELDLFALGMGLAALSAWSRERGEPGWLSHAALPWASWALAGVTFFGIAHLGTPILPDYVQSDLDLARQTLYGLFALFLLLPAVFGPQDRGLVRRFLRCWPMASLGVISYGIYLWHQTWIDETLARLGPHSLFNLEFWALFFGVLGASVAAATLSYFVVERPALRLKRRFAWWRPSGAHRRPHTRRLPPAGPASPG
jgi:peptidoglycan/LPS O-acetylase OafA/YrhL